MAEPYLSELRAIIAGAGLSGESSGGVECKHFFSGAAAYAGGHIFMTLTPVGLALKLPEEMREVLFAEGAGPLKYFPKAPVKKDYALLTRELAGDVRLDAWIARSIEFVG